MRSNWKSVIIENKGFSKVENFKLKHRGNFLNFKYLLKNSNKLLQKNIFFKQLQLLNLFSDQKFKILCSFLLENLQFKKSKELNIWSKARFILFQKAEQPYRVNIYNGRVLASILINEMKQGGRYGEFVFTKGARVIKSKSKRVKK